MTASFVLHCVVALAIVAAAASAIIGLALWLARSQLSRLAPAARRRLMLVAALAPAFLGFLGLAAALSASLGWISDHCLAHGPHHPHLCLEHTAATWPALPAIAVGAILALRLIPAIARALLNVRRSAATRRALDSIASDSGDGLKVLAHDGAQAFVVGLVAPQVYVSRGLLAAGADTVEAVLAHERAHLRRRDPLCRLIASLALSFHLPGLARVFAGRLARAQEMTADDDAARDLGDRARVAAALVRVSRARDAGPAGAMAFGAGDLEARVRALLADERGVDAPGRSALLAIAGGLLAAAAAAAGPIHHGLETFLGLLSS